MSDQRIPISQLSETQTAPDASYIAIDDGALTKKITVENFNSTSTASAQQYANQAAASAQTVEDNIATSAAQIREATLAAREATQASTSATASATSAYDSASLAQNYSVNAATSAGQAMNAADTVAQGVTESKEYAEDSEAWAVGKRNGTDVPSSDVAYHNNAKYYSDNATTAATSAESDADRAEAAADSINLPDPTLTVSGTAADSKAAGDAVRSLADMLETETVSDVSIAIVDDAAGGLPLKKLTAQIEPTQSGTGDPSPDNVRQISGYTGVTFTRTDGENPSGTIDTFGVTFPTEAGTVYGGTLIVNSDGSGTLTVDKFMRSCDADSSCGKGSNTSIDEFYFRASSSEVGVSGLYYDADHIVCSHAKNITGSSTSEIYTRLNSGQARIVFPLSYGMSDLATFKAWLGTQASGGTPLQFCYMLETPTTYALSAVQVVQMLQGANNIWTDVEGALSIIYYVDAHKNYAELADIRLMTNGVTAETAGDAVREQVTGLKNDLYKITEVGVVDNWVENAYIYNNVTIGEQVDLTPVSYTGARCAIVACSEGDQFTINCTGAYNGVAWSFIDADDVLIVKSGRNVSCTDLMLEAPQGAAKLIINDKPESGVFTDICLIGLSVASDISALENNVNTLTKNDRIYLNFKPMALISLVSGNTEPSDTVLCTDKLKMSGEYEITFPDTYEVYIATFWDGWQTGLRAYTTQWLNTGFLGILANNSDRYVIQFRRKDGVVIDISEAKNIVIRSVTHDDETMTASAWSQGTTNASGAIVADAKRVSTSDAFAFPYRGTFRIKLTSGFAMGIRSGPRSDNMPTNTYWLRNGDSYTVPDGHNYFRMVVVKDDGTRSQQNNTITPEDMDGVVCAIAWDKTPDVMAGNAEAIKTLDAASLIFSPTEGTTNGKRAVIAHTSDVHGDAVRLKRFADFCDAYGVDYAAVTGDFVAYNVEDGSNFLQEIIADHDTQFGICVGNHDVRADITDAEVYNYLMAPNADKLGNVTGKNYYYKDLASQNLRVLSISLYEEGIVASGTRRSSHQHMSSEQLAWICSTLKSTPAGYGIVIMMHTIQATTPMAEGYEEFYQVPLKYDNAGNTALGGAPVFDIVDAFVSRTTVNKSYNQTGTPSPISVSDDFSAVDSSVEFIAFMVGHWHEDVIAYTSTTVNKLLVLNVTCTNAIYGGDAYPYLAEVSDLHRNGRTQSQDAFNAYAIDRASKIVHVVRIGADTTYEMKKRQHMAIPYIVNA